MKITVVMAEHILSAVAAGVSVAVGELLSGTPLNFTLIWSAATVAYGASYAYQSAKAAINSPPATEPSLPVGAVISTSLNSGPTFQQGGVAVNVQLNAPQGTVQTVNGAAYTVGQPYNNATSASGDKVPNGAIYVGSGGFSLNGNYWY